MRAGCKRPQRLTEKQEPQLEERLQLNLRTVRAYLAAGGLLAAVGLPLADASQQVHQALVPARDALA